ncbi:MAG TPA: endonuclease/exonuclease/phosphatase family protein [Planctomycetota bacterium]|nr:endonuclease/exonuclease/phosphatase family protein [Planctomycetota bacterium]
MSDPRGSESSSSSAPLRLRIATYNVHSCVGVDGRCDPKRVAEVIQELRADIVALQEMTYPADLAIETRSPFVLPKLADYQCALGPTHLRAHNQFGNVILTRFPIRDLSRIDLSAHKREPRGALHVVLDAYGREFHVIATHLGLAWGERRVQVDRIVSAVRQISEGLFAIVGDFNDWLPGRSLVRVLDRRFGSPGSPRSFPARWPLIALDRVWVHPRVLVKSVEAHASPLAKKASDHLPVVAEIELAGLPGH